MNLTSRGLILTCLWLLPLGLGIFIGRQHQVPANQTSSLESASARSATSQNSAGGETSSSEQQAKLARERSTSPKQFYDRIEAARFQMAEILNTSNRIERTRQLIQLIDQLDPSDFEGVVSGFRESGWVEYNRSEYAMLLSAWMSQDPHAAIDYFDKSEPDGWSRKTAIAAWAAESPEAAANAIDGLEDEGEVNDWIVGLALGMARNDPSGALLALQELPADETRKQAIRSILPEVVSRGSDFAGEWIGMIAEPALQRDAATSLARPLADRDPIAAAEWVREMETVNTRRDASEIVADVYAANDLQGAKLWAESLPHDTMTEAAEGVAKHLARDNPADAAQWLQNLGNDPDLDGARIQFLREAVKQDPQIALDSVPTLSKTSDQERHYRDILKTWSKTDKEAAITWAIDNVASLPPKVVKSFVPKDQRPQ
ncbi:hypothetical protein N9A94_07900 [Akkermansiaceae bacterium]|nr:hypothetical protein [Akkermansiaceae bacterium]